MFSFGNKVDEIMEQLSLFFLAGSSRKSLLKVPPSFIYQGVCVTLVRKPYQRNIHLSVEAGGKVRVSCSRSTGLKEIRRFLGKHWQWIQKQILEQNRIKKAYPVKKFRVGEAFLFQGKILKLRYENISVSKKSFGLRKPLPFFYIKEKTLFYCWNKIEDLNKDTLKKKLRNFYETQGRQALHSALSHFSSLMGRLTPHSVRIGSQKSLWGSCSSAGDISLNWRLVATPPEVLNYVVIHELAHLQHLNHSNCFWSLVSQFCPEYKEHENWLRHHVYAMDFLLPRSELHSS